MSFQEPQVPDAQRHGMYFRVPARWMRQNNTHEDIVNLSGRR